jgi:predicted PolB exonuclease-like 3'-5' exonuclease
MKPLYFDCETAPLSEAELLASMPEFLPPGNYKDPDKIAANLAEQRKRWISEAALSAVTGQILCIGTLRGGEFHLWKRESEEELIFEFLAFLKTEIQSGTRIVGFCCKSFDLPYLVRRAWRYGIKVPFCLRDGRYFTNSIVDLAETWACAGRDPRDKVSLGTLAQFLGVGKKSGEGKDFARLWEEDAALAVAYLNNDLVLTQLCHERMQ